MHLAELVTKVTESLVPLLGNLVSVKESVAVTPLIQAFLCPPEHVDASGDEDEEEDDEEVHLLCVWGLGFRVWNLGLGFFQGLEMISRSASGVGSHVQVLGAFGTMRR